MVGRLGCKMNLKMKMTYFPQPEHTRTYLASFYFGNNGCKALYGVRSMHWQAPSTAIVPMPRACIMSIRLGTVWKGSRFCGY